MSYDQGKIVKPENNRTDEEASISLSITGLAHPFERWRQNRNKSLADVRNTTAMLAEEKFNSTRE